MSEQIPLKPLPVDLAAQLPERARQAVDIIGLALDRYHGLLEQIADLESAGITNASTWYRDGIYLYLIYPTTAEGRVRKYVGNDPAKVAAALARLERYKTHQELTRLANDLLSRLQTASHWIDELIYQLKEQ